MAASSTEQVFRYPTLFRVSLLGSAVVCLVSAAVAMILPWTETFRPTEPSITVMAVLIAMLVFLPLAGYFITACNRFWGRIVVDADGVTIRKIVGERRLGFDAIEGISIAGAPGGRELVLLARDSGHEAEILTHHMTREDEERLVRLLTSQLSDLVERQHAQWDSGDMDCEYSPGAVREGWYLVAIVNSIAWVIAGSLIWRFSANPLVVTALIAFLVAVLGLTVMVHQRVFSRRFALTTSGLRVWSVLGSQFVAYERINAIAFSRRQMYGAPQLRCAVSAPEGRWILTSNMRNFEAFLGRLVKRSVNAMVRGSLTRAISEEDGRILRVRDLRTMWFWFAASLFVGMLLVGWGLVAILEHHRLISEGSIVSGVITRKMRQKGGCWVFYEFIRPQDERLPHPSVYKGQAQVSPRDFDRFEVGRHIDVRYVRDSPEHNRSPVDTSYRFNWLFVAMGVVLFGYAGYQTRQILLVRRRPAKSTRPS